MKTLKILLVGLLFSFLPSVYADESDLVEQIAKQARPIIERREKHGGKVQELKLQLEGLAKDKQAVLAKIAVLNKEEPILDKAWELLKMEDYETAPVLNKVWEKLEIGEFESDKDFLARKETARVKAQKEFDLVYGEWKSKKATDKRVSDFEKKKALLKEKLTKEYNEAIVGWKSKVVAEDKKIEQIEKSSKLATSDLTEEINKLSTLQDVATFTLIYGAKQVSLPKFNREKMAFEVCLSTGIAEGEYGLIQSKKNKDLYAKIDELSNYKTKQYEVKFKTLEEAKSFKEMFESNKVFLEQKFSLRVANIPSSNPAYFEPRFYQAEVTKMVDVQVEKSSARIVTERVGLDLLYNIFGQRPVVDPSLSIPTTSTERRQVVTQPAIYKPEIKVDGLSYNFEVTECKAIISSSTGENTFSGEVYFVASISNSSKSKDPIQSSGTTETKLDLTKIDAAIEKEMVLVPAGKFKMGSPESEKGRDYRTEKQHEVTLTKPFYMGKYEVTQEQWKSVMGTNPSSGNKGAKLPVTNVSWNDCQEFIKKLNAKTNGGYRLPTEAEWEYACRAGTTTAYSFGDKITAWDANTEDSGGSIKAVGGYKPNAFGLYNMHGNVWEWCEDRSGHWSGDYPKGAVTDPKGPTTGEYRILRGGSFSSGDLAARSSNQLGGPPTDRFDSSRDGFRLARTVDTKTAVAEPTVPIPGSTELTPVTKELLVAPFNEAKAKEAQKEVAKSLKKKVEEKVDLGKGVNLEMVLIPAGRFKMGSPASEKSRSDCEKQHDVILTKPFFLGKYEVTQEQWQAVMGNNPSITKGAKLPVTGVSWDDCQEFIKNLNEKTSGGYRLPTEAEWEYACRAGTTTAYSFGDQITPKDANYIDSKIGKLLPVGSYKPNAFGLYDMHGNAYEWCEDSFCWYDYPAGQVTDPKGPAIEDGRGRVLRDGSFDNVGWMARSSHRSIGTPTGRYASYGFRLARTP